MENRSGQHVGRYEIVAELGRGAMGVVYKARDPKIDRFVALKTISLVGANPEEVNEFRERFFLEAQAAGRLVHPGIVTIFDVGEEPETHDPYIVMEYVTGRSLDRIISAGNGKLPLATALGLTEELAEALDYAHSQGVVHRDIKPANIVVTDEGHAKIADFGIAKLNLSTLTLPGRALGTPAYMSPEQLDGEPLDGRSDLFSLGVILYSMVTGYRPFQGNSVTTVCFKIANREPLQATVLNSALPAEVDALITRAMAKDPAQRYQRGADLAIDLRNMRERLQPQRIPSTNRSNETNHGRLAEKAIRPRESSVSRNNTGLQSGAAALRPFKTAVLNFAHTPGGKVLSISVAILMLLSLVWYGVVSLREKPIASSANTVRAEMAVKQNDARLAVSPPQSLPLVPANAPLDIQITHHFRAATVRMWLDNSLVYSHALQTEAKTRLVILRGTRGYQTGKMSVRTGPHKIRVRVQSRSEGYDQQKTISGEFAQNQSKRLVVTFEGHDKEMHLLLK